MSDGLLALYHRLPWPARHLAASAWGWRLRRQRWGAGSAAEVAAAADRETWDAAQWQSWTDLRMEELLRHAATRVPFYRERWRGSGEWQDLDAWPILSRDDVRRAGRRLIADDAPRRLTRERTSGTTGSPLSVWQEHAALRSWFALYEARIRRWHGVTREDRWAMLGGRLVTPVARRRPPFWVWNAPMRQLYLSAYHLGPELLPSYLDAMRRYRVRYLLGYASAMTALAHAALEDDRPAPRLAVAISNGEPLYPAQREAIAEAFGCPVRDTFGMAELVSAASECPAGELHLWPEVGVSEVLDDHGLPAAPGTSGRLVATGLLGRAMPLVRYDTGNRVVLATGDGGEDGACACGRRLPRLARLEGRFDDDVVTPSGRRIGRLDPVFKDDLAIRAAQIVQERRDAVVVRVVPAAGFDERQARRVAARTRQRLGDEMEVRVEEVAEIPRAAGGKVRGVVSLLSGTDSSTTGRGAER